MGRNREREELSPKAQKKRCSAHRRADWTLFLGCVWKCVQSTARLDHKPHCLKAARHLRPAGAIFARAAHRVRREAAAHSKARGSVGVAIPVAPVGAASAVAVPGANARRRRERRHISKTIKGSRHHHQQVRWRRTRGAAAPSISWRGVARGRAMRARPADFQYPPAQQHGENRATAKHRRRAATTPATDRGDAARAHSLSKARRPRRVALRPDNTWTQTAPRRAPRAQGLAY